MRKMKLRNEKLIILNLIYNLEFRIFQTVRETRIRTFCSFNNFQISDPEFLNLSLSSEQNSFFFFKKFKLIIELILLFEVLTLDQDSKSGKKMIFLKFQCINSFNSAIRGILRGIIHLVRTRNFPKK